ncbi:MAG: mechanosensitive ion channel family protein [Bacteroidaceae bacterium]|nr:mechanosensitive ion channel family protein [Bacteroidaceae bacterium]
MKKILFILLLLMTLVPQQGHAVLKEKDLGHTLHVLRLELYNKWTRQKERMKQMEERRKAQHARLVEVTKRCETTSLILYSQGQDFTFDMAYACQEATSLYQEFKKSTIPFDQIKQNIEFEITNYDSLIHSLKQIPPVILDQEKKDSIQILVKEEGTFQLDAQGIQDRAMCIEYAETLRANMLVILIKLEQENKYYTALFNRVERLNNFAQKKYTDLQQSIFINPGTSYPQILMAIPRQWERMKDDFNTKYKPLKERRNGQFTEYKSEWRGGIVMFASIFMLVYILGGIILSNVILRWGVPKRFRTETFMQKRDTLIMTLAVVIFAIAVMIVRTIFHHNLMLMATGLMIEMAWLFVAILVSLIIRLKGTEIKEGVKAYTPFMLMSIVVICFRIILIPNTLVNIIFPPILVIFTIWQSIMLKKSWKSIPTSDAIYCSVSLFAMLASCVLSWIGFTLMGVQIIVWWTFQLAAIASITCCYDLMEMYENRYLCQRIKKAYGDSVKEDDIRFRMKRGDFIDQTWVYDFVNRAFLPVCAVFSVMHCIYLAAKIFNLRHLCITWLMEEIHVDRLFTASAFKIFIVVALFFVFKYINYIVRSSWFRYRRRTKNKDFNATLARNIIALLIWGIYTIAVFLMLHVPGTGIAIVTGGLSTGMGFASKSLLENFFYGISLMSGRVRVGDYIEYDGMIGKVESITYQSTQITTLDGSVVAILNSDLFSKNFKNLTRNHQYERLAIPFGVSYGTNVDEVRHLIVEGIKKICKKTPDGRDIVNPKHPIVVAFADFGSSSVDLLLVVWVLVDQRISFTAQAKETIYQVLNANNIEIPFPQQDIYIRSITQSEQN